MKSHGAFYMLNFRKVRSMKLTLQRVQSVVFGPRVHGLGHEAVIEPSRRSLHHQPTEGYG